MKKLVLASAAALAVAFSASAFAAPPAKSHAHPIMEKTTSGTVASYAADTRMLKLKSGGEFTLGQNVTATTYHPGERVSVRWTMKDGKRIADRVKLN
jgi:hypothetical protein